MLRTTEVKNGKLRGIAGNDPRITAYKGIPFAAPPVGENRWKAPQPVENWEGELLCDDFGPISAQDQPGVGTDIYCREWHVDADIPLSEDCLYLNVWTPAKSKDEKLPVLVWYYGGGFQWGYTAEMEFNGEALAKRGIIVVSVAYRLAAFGFLCHHELSTADPEHPANFGLLDQKAGLHWVYENIAAFGGDPEKITIAGQSAGGASVQNQLAHEDNFNIIKGAAVFSGFISPKYFDDNLFKPMTLEMAEEKGAKFLEKLGVSTIEEARKIDTDTIINAYAKFRAENGMFAPIQDGKFSLGDPRQRIVDRQCADVPIIAGNTTDEFIMNGLNTVEKSVKDTFLDAEKNAPDQRFYYYRFDPDIPGDGADVDPFPGTFHSCDLWFFFDTIKKCHRPYKGRHFDLARQMADYFVNFIKTGNPNGLGSDGLPLPEWNTYTDKARNEMEFMGYGAAPGFEGGIRQNTRKQAVNPYLPSWEYIPDGEPYVFGDRIYVYGSHDLYGGETFCLGDYVAWSANINDLGNWRYEGISLSKTEDPLNKDGHMCLYAPDVTVGPDGKYYIYYVLDKVCVVSVAVSDKPAGPFKFIGYVHYEDGTRLGEKVGDEPQFDPGVLTEGDTTYLFTGFCGHGDKSRHGAMLTLIGPDMLTIKRGPEFIAPGAQYSEGTGYEGHAFFEAPSIRVRNGKYYFIYSSQVMHELCYAMSDSPTGPYAYAGVIVSNNDIGIGGYKKPGDASAFGGNNHGSIVQIGDDWYIFYHRHTNGTWFSRQGCAEKIRFTEDGHIPQVEITSCGLNGGPLSDIGEYPAYIACNIFTDEHKMYIEENCPRVVQQGGDDVVAPSYIKGIVNNTVIGFKYFDMKNVKGLRIKTRAYYNGEFEIRTSLDGEVLGTIKGEGSNIWTAYECTLPYITGVNALYIKYTGGGTPSLKSIEFMH